MAHDPALAQPVGPVVRAADLPTWQAAAAVLDASRHEASELRASTVAYRAAEAERGYQEGQALAAAELGRRLIEIDQAASASLRAMEAALPDLVCDLVSGMLGQVPVEQGLRLSVRHALGRLRRGTSAILRVSPTDRSCLQAVLDEAGGNAAGLALETDPGMAPGRCVLESELGAAELGLEAQMRVLRETLTTRWEHAA